MNWMIYGANGYTGELIAREAKKRGLNPILAGRSPSKLEGLASELGFEQRAFSLDDAAAVQAGLQDVGLVLHCAGPFSATSAPMVEACLAAQAHYLDITGEIPIFEAAKAEDERARAAGVVLCPGVGFDVVPTDCVAAALIEALPDATELLLGFDSDSPMSPGTAKTTVEGIVQGLLVRKNHRIEKRAQMSLQRVVDFGNGAVKAVAISWGDVSTAHFTTGIASIETYIKLTPELEKAAPLMKILGVLLRFKFLQNFIKRKIEKSVKGPSSALRDQQRAYVWGEASNAAGRTVTARVETENVYSLTITAALAVTQHILDQPPAAGGYMTPSRLCGKELVETLPGSGKITLS